LTNRADLKLPIESKHQLGSMLIVT